LISQLRSVSCVFTIKIGLDWIADIVQTTMPRNST